MKAMEPKKYSVMVGWAGVGAVAYQTDSWKEARRLAKKHKTEFRRNRIVTSDETGYKERWAAVAKKKLKEVKRWRRKKMYR